MEFLKQDNQAMQLSIFKGYFEKGKDTQKSLFKQEIQALAIWIIWINFIDSIGLKTFWNLLKQDIQATQVWIFLSCFKNGVDSQKK